MPVGRSSSPTHQKGALAEDMAARFLVEQGFELLAQNFNSRFGEIDLVVKEGSVLVFAEVRQRRAGSLVGALESITPAKQRRIGRTAMVFLQRYPHYQRYECRFDVLALTLQPNGQYQVDWIAAAFNAV